MTEEELTRLESLEKAATPGPWGVFLSEPGEIFGRRVAVISHKKSPTGDSLGRFAAVTWVNDDGGNADAICATAARNALPELIAEIRRLRAERQRLEFLMKFFCVEDVGDESVCPGVVVDTDAVGDAFNCGALVDERVTLMDGWKNPDMRRVIDKAIAYAATNTITETDGASEQ